MYEYEILIMSEVDWFREAKLQQTGFQALFNLWLYLYDTEHFTSLTAGLSEE